MATLQVKGLDDDFYAALGARASMDNRSISQEVVSILRQFLARPPAEVERAGAAFLEMCGSWQDDRSAGKIAGALRRARRGGRRFSRKRDVFA